MRRYHDLTPEMFEASSDGDYRNLLLVTAQRHGLEAVEGPGGGDHTIKQPMKGWAPCKPKCAPQQVKAMPFIFGVSN